MVYINQGAVKLLAEAEMREPTFSGRLCRVEAAVLGIVAATVGFAALLGPELKGVVLIAGFTVGFILSLPISLALDCLYYGVAWLLWRFLSDRSDSLEQNLTDDSHQA